MQFFSFVLRANYELQKFLFFYLIEKRPLCFAFHPAIAGSVCECESVCTACVCVAVGASECVCVCTNLFSFETFFYFYVSTELCAVWLILLI